MYQHYARLCGLLICLLFGWSCIMLPITLVYNLRIGETTRAKNPFFGDLYPSIIALTPFAQWRYFEENFKQSAVGLLGTYIYMHEDFYARINAAGGRVHAQLDDSLNIARAQADDLLFTSGYGWQLGPRTRGAFSIHFGIPLHKDDLLNFVELGTGHVGLGMQLDGSYAISDTQILLAAARFLYFFPRDLTFTANNVCQSVNYHLGDAVDFLLMYQQNWKGHLLALGYNPTLTFGADPIPPVTSTSPQIHTFTNSFYAAYRYGFPVKNTLSAVLIGLSYGFVTGNEALPLTKGHIINIWATWGVDF